MRRFDIFYIYIRSLGHKVCKNSGIGVRFNYPASRIVKERLDNATWSVPLYRDFAGLAGGITRLLGTFETRDDEFGYALEHAKSEIRRWTLGVTHAAVRMQ